jgi:hypothetical protein
VRLCIPHRLTLRITTAVAESGHQGREEVGDGAIDTDKRSASRAQKTRIRSRVLTLIRSEARKPT